MIVDHRDATTRGRTVSRRTHACGTHSKAESTSTLPAVLPGRQLRHDGDAVTCGTQGRVDDRAGSIVWRPPLSPHLFSLATIDAPNVRNPKTEG